jgi:hypothetical protein
LREECFPRIIKPSFGEELGKNGRGNFTPKEIGRVNDMISVRCNQCMKQYNDIPNHWVGNIAKCKACGSQFEITRPIRTLSSRKKSRGSLSVYFLIAVLVLCGTMATVSFFQKGLKGSVIEAASKAAINGVRMPSTAKIIGTPRAKQSQHDPNKWSVGGKIEAQNGFGINIIQPWYIDMERMTYKDSSGNPYDHFKAGYIWYGEDAEIFIRGSLGGLN